MWLFFLRAVSLIVVITSVFTASVRSQSQSPAATSLNNHNTGHFSSYNVTEILQDFATNAMNWDSDQVGLDHTACW
jgi:hypothetical protein